MAKRKTPKVDLKPRAEKITDQQLERLQKAVAGINKAKSDLGGLEIQKHSIVGVINELSSILTELRGEFKNDYGTDDINIQDGSIMYTEEDVKADS
jgi:hypothetical protein|tara:strand:+ start:79 stop:366 length:288 start_codon:yes stop_codon:yes gene_type:complete